MGLIDLPTATELSETIQFVIPSEDRDFSRPRDSYYAQSIPADSAMADDGDVGIKSIQKIMQNNPIGPSYPKDMPIDGKINRKLLDVLLNFSWKIKDKTGETFNIVKGNSIDQTAFLGAMRALKKHLGQTTESIEEKPSSEIILAFQKFFGTPQPLIGRLYKGKEDGEINDDLIAAARSTEEKIASILKNKGVTGMIWNGSSFKTTPNDVSSALSLLAKREKIANLTSKNRIKVFSAILDQ